MQNRKIVCLGIAVLVSAGIVWAVVQRQRAGRDNPALADSDTESTTSPYRNAQPNVAYVGDEACGRCHQAILDRFRQHPMGQSLAPEAQIAAVERFDPGAHPTFTAAGLQYEVSRMGDAVVHRQTLRDSQGRVVAGREAAVHYAVGSGARGRSYLIDLDGQLVLSPISWFSQAQRWDVSPGYKQGDYHFERAAKVDCLFCHSNRVQPTAHAINHYEEPVFRGLAIGCERCHGPGELHVREQDADQVRPYSIVNPKRLSPALRDAVCEQCHLQGVLRVPRQGCEEFDYRPGLPLHKFIAVFVPAGQSVFDKRAVGQVEQVASSQCAVKSKGRLGCISCHDPHNFPPPQAKAAFYRERCLACHDENEKVCKLPEPRRRETTQDNCVACHMPRLATADVAHTAITDHRILARPGQVERSRASVMLQPWQSPLVAYHQRLLPAGLSLGRELGLALTQMGQVEQQPHAFQLALPRLQESLESQPDDLPVLAAKGIVLVSQGLTGEAAKTFERILAPAPDHEQALAWAGVLAEQQGQPERAEKFWRRVLKVNPNFSNYHLSLARVLSQRQRWQEASEEATAALRLNPMRLDARRLLIGCYVRLGDREKVEAEWEKYQAFQPPDLEAIRKLVNERK